MKPKDLRDEFALAVLPEAFRHAMAEINKGCHLIVKGKKVMAEEYIAALVGEIADAMMAEREKTA